MDAGVLRGLYTVFMFAAFIGIVWWAWSARRKRDFDEAASLPLEDDDVTSDHRNRTHETHDGVKQS
jgi:cytochrome c oxidase cbb3-type subunit 4